ncbi:hypothetical protein PI125_g26481 [Phytophthora idaei]|nr:hypothetical protein PI125_g26481 [Phytophthora idaei]
MAGTKMPMVVEICSPRPRWLRRCGGDSSFTYAPMVPVAAPEAIPATARPTANGQMLETEA